MIKIVATLNKTSAAEAMSDMDNNLPVALSLPHIPMDMVGGIITYTPWSFTDISSILEYKYTAMKTFRESVFSFAKCNLELYVGFFSPGLLSEIESAESLNNISDYGGELAMWASLLSSNVRKVPLLKELDTQAKLVAADELSIQAVRELDHETVKKQCTIDNGEGSVVNAALVGLVDKRSKALERMAQAYERGRLNESSDKVAVNIVTTNNDNRSVTLLPKSLDELENMTSVSMASLRIGGQV